MQSQYTDKARTALILAEKAARKLKQNYVGTEHILLGLLEEGTGVAARVLIENGANELEIREMIEDLIAPVSETPVKERDGYSPRAMAILEESHRQAARFNSALTGTEHILLSLLREGENVAVRLLNTCGLQPQKLYMDTLAAMGLEPGQYKEELIKKQKKKGSTATLEQYSRDMTALARDGRLDPVIGREEEISRVIQILSRRTKDIILRT